jgi:hypothetical protein
MGNRFQDGVLGKMALIALQLGKDFFYVHKISEPEYHPERAVGLA